MGYMGLGGGENVEKGIVAGSRDHKSFISIGRDVAATNVPRCLWSPMGSAKWTPRGQFGEPRPEGRVCFVCSFPKEAKEQKI